MNKRRLSKILAKASPQQVQELAGEIKTQHEITVVKAPEKSLVMIKMRDPVKESLFYLGEVIVSEAIVDLDGAKGTAVLLGDDYEKALDMAVIDAACNKGVFARFDVLEQLEAEQNRRTEQENALFLKTMVNFTSMDSEAAQ
ncbi:MAG TPA: phosphonate C-P lyase system protein PhnG [Candidatus Merdivicinus intestinigallinarum]|nr:phosphonate C-P lyase system protein PhnG [Candidatus Merdivicinus intestinigallinarum]